MSTNEEKVVTKGRTKNVEPLEKVLTEQANRIKTNILKLRGQRENKKVDEDVVQKREKRLNNLVSAYEKLAEKIEKTQELLVFAREGKDDYDDRIYEQETALSQVNHVLESMGFSAVTLD